MATNRKKRVEDDEELPVTRGKIVVPAKRVVNKKAPKIKPKAKAPPPKKPAVKARARRQLRNTDDAIDSMEGAHRPPMRGQEDGPDPVMEGFPQTNRRTAELELQLRARLNKQPVFPYPPELDEELKPYWIELVNSFPHDHFQISDTTLMKMYCQCAYDIERQSAMIKAEGEIVMGARGPIVNPRCKVRESNRGTLLSLSTKFRNQPASRVNSEGFKGRRARAEEAARGAAAIGQDEDGLLAGGDGYVDDDVPHTRH